MLKSCAQVKQTPISINSFERYLKCVNNPQDPFFSPDEDILHFVDKYEKKEFRILFAELNAAIEYNSLTAAIKHLNTKVVAQISFK